MVFQCLTRAHTATAMLNCQLLHWSFYHVGSWLAKPFKSEICFTLFPSYNAFFDANWDSTWISQELKLGIGVKIPL